MQSHKNSTAEVYIIYVLGIHTAVTGRSSPSHDFTDSWYLESNTVLIWYVLSLVPRFFPKWGEPGNETGD